MNRPNAALAGLVLTLALAGVARAQGATCPPGLPPGVYCGSKDATDLTAGAYKLDASHTAIMAAVSHIGYGYSLFRFGDAQGQLTWDPADVSKSRLSVTVKTASIETPVPKFAAELAGPNFLKSAAIPDATFVSTAFRRTDATHGEVDGDFTLLGKTRPVTFKVELVGAGKGFGHPRAGVHAVTTIVGTDYGMGPMFGQVGLAIDAEFEKAS